MILLNSGSHQHLSFDIVFCFFFVSSRVLLVIASGLFLNVSSLTLHCFFFPLLIRSGHLKVSVT